MATTFPTSLDAFTNPTTSTVLDQPGIKHSDQHININDSVEAVEAKLGIDLSSVQNSIDYIARLFLITQTEHYSAAYSEIVLVTGRPWPASVTWYTSSAKTIKLVEKEFAYGSVPVPTTVTMRLYNGTVANTVVRTITDTITYTNNVFEATRTRVVS